MRPSHLPLKFGDSQEAEDVLHHMGMHTLASKSMREQGQQAAWTPEQGFFLKRQKRMFGGSKLHGLSQNHTANLYVYIYTHIIYIYSFIVVQHHFVGRAMAKSCQRQSRHGRTQRLNSWTSSCNNNNSGSDTFQPFQCSPRGFQHFSAMCRCFHVDLQLDTHNRGDQSALRRWQVAQEVPAAVPVLSVFGDLDVPRMGWKAWTGWQFELAC